LNLNDSYNFHLIWSICKYHSHWALICILLAEDGFLKNIFYVQKFELSTFGSVGRCNIKSAFIMLLSKNLYLNKNQWRWFLFPLGIVMCFKSKVLAPNLVMSTFQDKNSKQTVSNCFVWSFDLTVLCKMQTSPIIFWETDCQIIQADMFTFKHNTERQTESFLPNRQTCNY
jgi:hypothetical protein